VARVPIFHRCVTNRTQKIKKEREEEKKKKKKKRERYPSPPAAKGGKGAVGIRVTDVVRLMKIAAVLENRAGKSDAACCATPETVSEMEGRKGGRKGRYCGAIISPRGSSPIMRTRDAYFISDIFLSCFKARV